MNLLWVLVAVAAVPAEIAVSVEADDTCNFEARVPVALKQVLPGILVLEGGATSKDRLRLEIRVQANTLRFQVIEYDGTRAMSREVQRSPGACAATADAVALVVERYFLDLGYEPAYAPLPTDPEVADGGTGDAGTTKDAGVQPDRPDAAVVEKEEPDAGVEIVPPDTEEPNLTETGTTASSTIGLALGVRGLLEAPSAVSVRAGVGAMVRFEIGFFEIAAEIAGLFPQHQDIRANNELRGEARVWSLLGMGGGGVCYRGEGASGCLSLRGGVERVEGSVVDPDTNLIFQEKSQTVVRPLGLVEVRYQYAVASLFELSAAVSALIRPRAIEFEVEGATSSYRDPTLTVILSFGGWVRFF